MTISKALITAAGRNQRQLPLQTIVDREGYPRSVLTQLVEEAVSAGIESVGIVVSPGDAELYHRAAGEHAKRITFIEQEKPDGYGAAIHRGSEFLGGDHFLLMVSDHLYISGDPAKSCARQLVEAAAAERCGVSAVQSTHESNLSSFGAVGGRLFDGRTGIYEIESVIEKHYAAQIAEISSSDPDLAAELSQFRDEELSHKDHAMAEGATSTPGYPLLAAVIKAGCLTAIKISEKL